MPRFILTALLVLSALTACQPSLPAPSVTPPPAPSPTPRPVDVPLELAAPALPW